MIRWPSVSGPLLPHTVGHLEALCIAGFQEVQVDVAGQDNTLLVVTLRTVLVPPGHVDGNWVIVTTLVVGFVHGVEYEDRLGVADALVTRLSLGYNKLEASFIMLVARDIVAEPLELIDAFEV